VSLFLQSHKWPYRERQRLLADIVYVGRQLSTRLNVVPLAML
jgi:hypothetical protein